MPRMNKDVEIDGVKVTLCAIPAASGYTWEFRSENGLRGANTDTPSANWVKAWDDAKEAAKTALRDQVRRP